MSAPARSSSSSRAPAPPPAMGLAGARPPDASQEQDDEDEPHWKIGKKRQLLTLHPFTEKSAFVRQDREIVSKRAAMPRIICPKIAMLSTERFAELLEQQKNQLDAGVRESELVRAYWIHQERKGKDKVLVATLCEEEEEFFTEEEFQVDADVDDEERWDAVAAEMDEPITTSDEGGIQIEGREKKRDALGIGPLPLTWVIPDRQYKPTRPTLKLLPGSKFEAFFRSWGIVEKAEMIFQQDRTIYLLVRFAKREVMAQAALSLWGGRYFGFVPPRSAHQQQEEIFPVNLCFCDYEGKKAEILAEQTSFEEITRGLSAIQAKAFRELSEEVARLETDNKRLELEVKGLSERQKQRKQEELDGVPLSRLPVGRAEAVGELMASRCPRAAAAAAPGGAEDGDQPPPSATEVGGATSSCSAAGAGTGPPKTATPAAGSSRAAGAASRGSPDSDQGAGQVGGAVGEGEAGDPTPAAAGIKNGGEPQEGTAPIEAADAVSAETMSAASPPAGGNKKKDVEGNGSCHGGDLVDTKSSASDLHVLERPLPSEAEHQMPDRFSGMRIVEHPGAASHAAKISRLASAAVLLAPAAAADSGARREVAGGDAQGSTTCGLAAGPSFSRTPAKADEHYLDQREPGANGDREKPFCAGLYLGTLSTGAEPKAAPLPVSCSAGASSSALKRARSADSDHQGATKKGKFEKVGEFDDEL